MSEKEIEEFDRISIENRKKKNPRQSIGRLTRREQSLRGLKEVQEYTEMNITYMKTLIM